MLLSLKFPLTIRIEYETSQNRLRNKNYRCPSTFAPRPHLYFSSCEWYCLCVCSCQPVLSTDRRVTATHYITNYQSFADRDRGQFVVLFFIIFLLKKPVFLKIMLADDRRAELVQRYVIL